MVINKLNVKEFDAIVFVGGLGTSEYVLNKTAHAVAQKSVKQNKVLAGICWAPIIFANAGVLEGKKATASMTQYLIKDNGGTYTRAKLTVDGKIVTANGPAASADFADAIIKLLKAS